MTEEKEVATEKNGQVEEDKKAEEDNELESAIIRQVEYYFGKFNVTFKNTLGELMLQI